MEIGIAPCTEGAPMVHQDLQEDQQINADLGLDKKQKTKKLANSRSQSADSNTDAPVGMKPSAHSS